MDLAMVYSISNMPQSPMKYLPRELMVVMFFAWRNNSISKSIGDYTTDRLTYKIKIPDDIFFDDMIFIRYSISKCIFD
jgi:hypothetical protein